MNPTGLPELFYSATFSEKMKGTFWGCFRLFGGDFRGVMGRSLGETGREKAEKCSQTHYLK